MAGSVVILAGRRAGAVDPIAQAAGVSHKCIAPVAGDDDPLEPVEDAGLVAKLEAATRALLPELWPFDYGRFEYRYEPATGEIWFMEVNLSCNLWSKKTISRSAASIGIGHEALVEHILAQSMLRQGVIQRQLKLRHAA